MMNRQEGVGNMECDDVRLKRGINRRRRRGGKWEKRGKERGKEGLAAK